MFRHLWPEFGLLLTPEFETLEIVVWFWLVMIFIVLLTVLAVAW